LTKTPKNSIRWCPAETNHVFLRRVTLRTRTVLEFAKIVVLVWAGFCLFVVHADAQTALGETLRRKDEKKRLATVAFMVLPPKPEIETA
jgi:hypothetical protein